MKKFIAAVLALAALPAMAQTFNQRAVVSATGSGDHTIVTGVAGKITLVYGFDISLTGAVDWSQSSHY